MRALLAVLFVGLSSPVGASVIVPLYAVVTVQDTGIASFGIYFNTAPDWTTTDQYGRLATIFQFSINAAGPVVYPGQFLIRKVEDHYSTDAVNVVSVDPHGESWGPIVGSAAFVHDGHFAGFSVPLAMIGAGDGGFYWSLLVCEFGGTVINWPHSGIYTDVGHAMLGDVPTALADGGSGAALLAGALGLLVVLRRRRRR